MYLVILGIGMFLVTYIYMYIWTYTGEMTSKRIRERYLKAVLRQDVAFFDQLGAGEVATRIQTDTHLIQQGISEKVASTCFLLPCFICFTNSLPSSYHQFHRCFRHWFRPRVYPVLALGSRYFRDFALHRRMYIRSSQSDALPTDKFDMQITGGAMQKFESKYKQCVASRQVYFNITNIAKQARIDLHRRRRNFG